MFWQGPFSALAKDNFKAFHHSVRVFYVKWNMRTDFYFMRKNSTIYDTYFFNHLFP